MPHFCSNCTIEHFQETFEDCGNVEINDIITTCQREASNFTNMLEFIPFQNFYNIKKIKKGGFGQVFKACWLKGGRIESWNIIKKVWKRSEDIEHVALKTCKDFSIFLNEVSSIHHLVCIWTLKSSFNSLIYPVANG